MYLDDVYWDDVYWDDIYLLRGVNLAELIQRLFLSVANDIAELPRGNAKRALDVVRILEFLDELVENLTRLLSLEADERRDEVACRYIQIRSIECGDGSSLCQISIAIISSIDIEGDLLIGR